MGTGRRTTLLNRPTTPRSRSTEQGVRTFRVDQLFILDRMGSSSSNHSDDPHAILPARSRFRYRLLGPIERWERFRVGYSQGFQFAQRALYYADVDREFLARTCRQDEGERVPGQVGLVEQDALEEDGDGIGPYR
jgi:hypothetical protein